MTVISLDNLKTTVEKDDWKESVCVHVTIKSAINHYSNQKLSATDTRKFQKIVSVYNDVAEMLKAQELGTAFEPRIGTFEIREITNEKEIRKIQKITALWVQQARRIHNLALVAVLQVPEEKRLRAATSLDQITVTHDYLKNDYTQEMKEGVRLSVAINRLNRTLEGLVVTFPDGDCLHILNLVTNPKNLMIFDTEQEAVRGAGTRLIEQSAFNAVSKYNKSKLQLETLPASRLFYEKLGFVDQNDGEEDHLELPFEIIIRFADKVLKNLRK